MTLEQRVLHLERSNRRWRLVVLAIVPVCLCAGFAADSNDCDVVMVVTFNAKGQEMVRAGDTEGGCNGVVTTCNDQAEVRDRL